MNVKNLTRIIVLVIILTRLASNVKGQVSDNFSDGDFSNDPNWFGDIAEFEIESGQLNSNGPSATAVLHLTTANSLSDQTTWEFLIDLGFAPSSSNKVRAYLMSNNSDLEGSLEGYFIEIGQSGNDEIKFYRQDANDDETLLFTGSSQLSGNVSVRIQIKRDGLGNWQINSDPIAGTAYSSEGAPFLDNTYSSTSFFGFVCFHTSSRRDLFFFDDISISSDIKFVDDVEVLSKNEIVLTFNLHIDESTAETISNYYVDNSIGIPSSAILNTSDPNRVNLIFEADFQNENYTITIDGIKEVDNNDIVPKSIANFNYLPLLIDSISVLSTRELEITYNQNVDAGTAQLIENYSVNFEIGRPSLARVELVNPNLVQLTFPNSFANNDYDLTIQSVLNTSGNAIADNLVSSFEVITATPARALVINEIFPDPSPLVGLPSTEFVEILNRSDKTINIGDFDLSGGTIPDFQLAPGGLIILTPTSSVLDFEPFGDVLVVSSWNTLTNSGEQILLKDNLGNAIDSLTYNLDWYHDENKEDGGWSIEQIDPDITCNYQGNWSASINVDGGSPGAENSIFDDTPDTTGPDLIDVEASDESTLKLTFNEPMDEGRFISANYLVTTGLTVVGTNSIDPSLFLVEIGLETALISGNEYEVTVTGPTDCAGNELVIDTFIFLYDIEPPVLEQIIINSLNKIELVFDEEVEESEAERESNFLASQELGNPASAIRSEGNSSRILLTFDNEFTPLQSNLLTISGLQDSLGNTLINPIETAFAYDQSIDTVIVLSINQMDVLFSQSVDANTALELTNYSVDNKVGQPILVYSDHENDKLFHLVFENNFDDNKELTLSTLDIKNLSDEFIPTPEYSFVYDTRPPKIESVVVVDEHTLNVKFDEKVELLSAESIENYFYNEYFSFTRTLIDNDSTVVLVFENAFEREVTYELIVDNVEDIFGNAIKTRIRNEFTYDIFPPELDSLIVQSSTELVLIFNESINKEQAGLPGNFSVGSGLDNPSEAFLDGETQNKVSLSFSNPFPEIDNIPINISNLADIRGNTLIIPIQSSFRFDHFNVGRIEALSNKKIELEFNKVPDASSSLNAPNYLINGNENPTFIDLISERKIVLTLPNNLEDKSKNSLSILNITDQNSSLISQTEYDFQFDSKFSGIKILNGSTLELELQVGLDVTLLPEVSLFELSPDIINPIIAVPDQKLNNIIRLIFENEFNAGVPYNLSWPILTNEFGNTIPAFSVDFSKDTVPPEAIEVIVLSSNSLNIQFTEPLDPTTAENIQNYEVSLGIGSPSTAEYIDPASSVVLEFTQEFEDGISYDLNIENIKDTNGNIIIATQNGFTFIAPNVPKYGELIITEIMADPDPEVGLPQTEYLELYNTSGKDLELAGLILQDGNGSTKLSNYLLLSDSYVLLVPTSGAGLFTGIETLGVSSWRSLSNRGETISIYDDDELVFSTSYDQAWYKDSSKEDGGWSLEMIDTNNPCGEINNWTASIGDLGGTPGVQNSVDTSNPDNLGPQVLSAIAHDDSHLKLIFDEKLDPVQFQNSSFSIEPNLEIVSADIILPKGYEASVFLKDEIIPRTEYTITASGYTDCVGNFIRTESNSQSFVLPEAGVEGDIILNEILFNPRSGGVDFVEIYNKSDKAINLKKWQLANLSSNDEVDSDLISIDDLIFQPDDFLVFTSDLTILKADYPGSDETTFVLVSPFPSYSDSQGSVILLDSLDNVIDLFDYDTDFHFNLLDDVNGVSLERISFDGDSNNPSNWKSAASHAGFATPGLMNSQFISNVQSSGTITIEPKVFVPDNTGVNDFTTINYELQNAGGFANVNIYDAAGRLIKNIVQGDLLSTSGFFTWDGTDNSGSRARAGYYAIYFEVFDSNGNKDIMKETVVLGTRF